MARRKRSALVASVSLPFSSAASCSLYRAGFGNIGLVPSLAFVLEFMQRATPDILIVDTYLSDTNGTHCAKVVKKRYPDCKVVLLLAAQTCNIEATRAIKSGADGVSCRRDFLSQSQMIIDTVLNGAFWLGCSKKRLPHRPCPADNLRRNSRNFRVKEVFFIAALFLLASSSVIAVLKLLSF